MSVSGSGVGSLGGPQQQAPYQQELSATVQNARQQMNMTKNTDDIPFTTFGKTGLGADKKDFYSSDSTNPQLPKPSTTQRSASGIVDQPGVQWQETYQQLLQMLPQNQQDALAKNAQLPEEDQSPYLNAFNEFMESTAVAVSYFDGVVGTQDSESAQIGSISNGSVPLNAVGTASLGSIETSANSAGVLNDIGPNDPGYDNATLATNTIGSFSATLGSLYNEIGQTGMTPDAQNGLSDLADTIATFQPQANTLLSSGNLGVLQNTLGAAGSLAGAAGLPGASAFTLNSTSAFTGLQGTSLGNLASGIGQGLQQLAFPGAGASVTQALTDLTMVGLLAAGLVAEYTSPDGDPTAVDTFKQEMGLALITATGMLPTIFGDGAAAIGANEYGQQVISAALTSVSLLMTAYIWTPDSSGAAVNVPSELAPTLIGSLNTIASAIEDGVNNGTLNMSATAAAADLQQAAIALQNGNDIAFQNNLQNALSLLGINFNDLQTDLESIGSMANASETAVDPSNSQAPTQTISG